MELRSLHVTAVLLFSMSRRSKIARECKFGKLRRPRGISDRISAHNVFVITGLAEKKLPCPSEYKVPISEPVQVHMVWPTPRGSTCQPIGS